jgi:hypothetical protein
VYSNCFSSYFAYWLVEGLPLTRALSVENANCRISLIFKQKGGADLIVDLKSDFKSEPENAPGKDSHFQADTEPFSCWLIDRV